MERRFASRHGNGTRRFRVWRRERYLFYDECFLSTPGLFSRMENPLNSNYSITVSGPYDNQPARLILTAGALVGRKLTIGWRISRECTNDMPKRRATEPLYRRRANWRSNEFQNGRNAYWRGPQCLWVVSRWKGSSSIVTIIALYNSNNKRQTTFAGVDVSPILNDDVISDINIPDSDMHGDYHHEIWWSWRSECEQGQQCRSNKAHSNGN